MRKAFFTLTLLLIMATNTVSVYAQSPTVSPSPSPKLSQEEKKQQKLLQIQERQVETLKQIVNRIITKTDDRLELFNKFVTKLETRRGRLAQESQDVTQLDNQIRIIKTELGAASSTINQSQDKLGLLDYSRDIKMVRADIFTELRLIRLVFSNLHQLMSVAVNEASSLSD